MWVPVVLNILSLNLLQPQNADNDKKKDKKKRRDKIDSNWRVLQNGEKIEKVIGNQQLIDF